MESMPQLDSRFRKEWRPNPGPQEFFLASDVYELGYGGAAGGGKSESLIVDALAQTSNKNHRALLLRRTYPELERSLIRRSLELYHDRGTFNQSKHLWEFSSGATVEFGYCDGEKDVYKYQSAEYNWLGLDEATHFTEFQYLYLTSRVRSTDSTLKKYVRLATNPGNVGHSWFKKRFIEGRKPFKTYWYKRETDVEIECSQGDKKAISRSFVPAKVFDNPILLSADPQYVERLKMLPESERRALLEGDWDVFAGQYFNEWRYDKHVIEPFAIPESWRRIAGFDFGVTNPSCYLEAAIDHDGTIWVIKEHYQAGLTAQQTAEAINNLVHDWGLVQYVAADKSIWARTHEVDSIVEVLERHGMKKMIQARMDRIAGWNEVKEYLRWDSLRKPKLKVFSTCQNLIRTLPLMIHARVRPEDLDTSLEDHAVDALRYMVFSLREQKSPKVESLAEKKLRMFKEDGSYNPQSFYE